MESSRDSLLSPVPVDPDLKRIFYSQRKAWLEEQEGKKRCLCGTLRRSAGLRIRQQPPAFNQH